MKMQLDWTLNGLHRVCALIQSLAISDWVHIWIEQLRSRELNVSNWACCRLHHMTGTASMCCGQNIDCHSILFVSCPASLTLCRCYPSPKPNWEVRMCLSQTNSGLWHMWKGNSRPDSLDFVQNSYEKQLKTSCVWYCRKMISEYLFCWLLCKTWNLQIFKFFIFCAVVTLHLEKQAKSAAFEWGWPMSIEQCRLVVFVCYHKKH